ncbi:MAG: hypothetical protein RQ753_01925 [Desulfurivibrionaceae bacterium]|nr:hypothetical protein [Desulfobulbales bacterium]MDT8334434.1 hypothetical protein [Desulfurivibrionaceae bacterium]
MQQQDERGGGDGRRLTSFPVMVPEDLYRAYQRCTWIIINETGGTQLEIMEEMVRDFLGKHGC